MGLGFSTEGRCIPSWDSFYPLDGVNLMPTHDVVRAIAFLRGTGGDLPEAKESARRYHIAFTDQVWQEANEKYWTTDCQNCGWG